MLVPANLTYGRALYSSSLDLMLAASQAYTSLFSNKRENSSVVWILIGLYKKNRAADSQANAERSYNQSS